MLDNDVVYHISLFEITCHKGSHVVSLTLEKRDIFFQIYFDGLMAISFLWALIITKMTKGQFASATVQSHHTNKRINIYQI